MGLLNLPRIPRGASVEQMANIYNMAIEEMEHRVNGFLQSSNIQEIGGYFVNKTELKHKDGDVGLSSEDTGGDDVRLWAGSTDKNTAPWNVTKSGKMHATGATIESSSGYPKFLLDPDSGTIKAMLSADTYLEIVPNYNGSTPIVNINQGGVTSAQIYCTTDNHIRVIGTSGMELKTASGDIQLLPDQISNGKVKIGGSFSLLVQSDGTDLQSKLNLKANWGANTSDYTQPDHNHGIAPGTKLATTSDGTTVSGFVTWAASGGFTHHHTQS